MGGDKLAHNLRVPENEGCLSFVRLNREVSYTTVPRIFGRAVSDKDRFIGIEVASFILHDATSNEFIFFRSSDIDGKFGPNKMSFPIDVSF